MPAYLQKMWTIPVPCFPSLHEKIRLYQRAQSGGWTSIEIRNPAEYIPAGGTSVFHLGRNPLPIARRYWFLKQFKNQRWCWNRQVSWLRFIAASNLPGSLQWHILTGSSYSGGTAPALTGFLLKSCDTYSLSYAIFMFILALLFFFLSIRVFRLHSYLTIIKYFIINKQETRLRNS